MDFIKSIIFQNKFAFCKNFHTISILIDILHFYEKLLLYLYWRYGHISQGYIWRKQTENPLFPEGLREMCLWNCGVPGDTPESHFSSSEKDERRSYFVCEEGWDECEIFHKWGRN